MAHIPTDLCACGHHDRYHFADGTGHIRCRATADCACVSRETVASKNDLWTRLHNAGTGEWIRLADRDGMLRIAALCVEALDALQQMTERKDAVNETLAKVVAERNKLRVDLDALITMLTACRPYVVRCDRSAEDQHPRQIIRQIDAALDWVQLRAAPETPQAPIAKVIVREDGPADVMLYAPGLPPGEHDLYCEPPAPGGQKVPHPCFAPETTERCPETFQPFGGTVIPCALPAGHSGKHQAPGPLSEKTGADLWPVEREELIRWHKHCAAGCLQQDDFNGQRQHEMRADELERNAQKTLAPHLSQLPPEFDEAGRSQMRAKARARSAETFGHMSDEWVADRVRMLMRDDLYHEAICTAARDRIMRLSLELERLRRLQDVANALDDAVAEFGLQNAGRIAEAYQQFHDVLHDGHGAQSAPDVKGD